MLLMEQRMRFLMIRIVMVICREEGTRKGGLSYAPQGIGDEIVTDSTSNGNGNGTSRKNVVVTNSGPRSTSESSQNLSLTEGKKQLSCEWIIKWGRLREAREANHAEGESSQMVNESALYYEAVEGVKKRNVYGLGSQAFAYYQNPANRTLAPYMPHEPLENKFRPVGLHILDDTINMKTQELLENDKSGSFLLKGPKKSINQSDLESCEYSGNKSDDDSNLEKPIQRIDYVNTSYSIAQETSRPDEVESEHLYSASANEIDEKKPELKILPHHLEYAYLHGDKSFPIIISFKLSEKEKM
ncbi:hypothetical protein Tco_1108986 [Tanacetum coccineum]